MGKKIIPMRVIRRLPKYRRYLGELLINDVNVISSKKFGDKYGFTAPQIRKDLNYFGYFGKRGVGYNVKKLFVEISDILGLFRKYKIVIIGAGNIGKAVANSTIFVKLNFELTGIFDVNPKLIGLEIQHIKVLDIYELEMFLKGTPIDIAIICVSNNNAQTVANLMVKYGIKGILNFSSVDLQVPEEIILENIRLNESLATLRYLINAFPSK